MAKTDQELAQEEINNRQYMYGGLGPFSQFLSGERREIIRPESTEVVGFGAGPTGVEYITETIPAEYGPVEYDPSYSPARRGLSALGDILYEAPSFFGLRGPDEQVEAMQAVGSSLRDALFGSAEYMSEQARAAASGGEYFDPETGRTVAFDPTVTMFGGNPAEGAVLGSGVRAGRAARVRPYEQFGGNLQEARDRLGVTAEAARTYREGRQGFKSEVPSEIREAAEKVYNGEMNVNEYNEIVRRVLPPETIGQVLEVPTLEQIALALDKPAERTGGIIGLNVDIPDGTPASSRLDIPAYERAGTWIATVHEGGKEAGSVLGYGPTAVLNNVTFKSKPKVALDIARDASNKTTIGRMDGSWENRDPKIVEQQVRDILNGTAPDADQWVEVGMNPIRGSFFYDKKTFQPVGETEQVLQVGPVVLAKRPTYIPLDDPRNQVLERGQPKLDKSGNPVFFSGGGRTGTGIAAGSSIANAARLRRAEDEYIRSINPEGVRIAPNDRPNLAMGDMYGMAPRNATEIMRQDLPSGGVVRYVQGDDGVYALGYNPDLGEEDVIGYMLGRGDGTELSVVNEMQGQGIGGNLSYLYRSQNPMAPSGGLTEAGEAAARSAYRRMLSDRSRPDFDMDTTYYHGTSSDFAEFTPSEVGDLGPGIYMTPNPEKASGYAAMRRFMRRDTNNASPNVMPLRLRKDLNFLDLQGRAIMPFDEDRIQRLRDSGYDGIRQLDESGNVTQLNIFDPENIRSVNAEFKPGESANILYSGGGNTGTGIAIASSLRNELERRLGGDIPEVDRDTTLLGRVGDARSVNEMNVDMSAPQLSSFPIARAEDLIDRAYMTGITDTSRPGLERVTSVNNIPVDSLQRGGFAFGMQPENIDRNIAFASAENAVRAQLNRARAAQALSGRPGVIFAPHGMVGSSPDFATMSTDIAVPYARQVMSRADKQALDQRIREGAGNLSGAKAPIPDFPGIDRATPEYLSSIGGKRKNILQALDEKPAQQAGALSRSQVRAIVTEPSEFNAPFGQVNAFYELDPRYYREKNPLDPVASDHPSYAMALSGRPIGLAREGFSIFDLDPSMFGLDGIPAVDFMEELARRRMGAERRLADALAGNGDISRARTNLRGYDFPGLYGDGGYGSSVQGMLKSGGQGVITQEMVDDLLRRGLIID